MEDQSPYGPFPDATDLVDGNVPVSVDPHLQLPSALDAFSTITCTATDDHDNVVTHTFTISVVDTTAPVLPTLDDIVVEATGPGGA